MKKVYTQPVSSPFGILMKEAMCAYPATPTKAAGFGDPAPARRTPLS